MNCQASKTGEKSSTEFMLTSSNKTQKMYAYNCSSLAVSVRSETVAGQPEWLTTWSSGSGPPCGASGALLLVLTWACTTGTGWRRWGWEWWWGRWTRWRSTASSWKSAWSRRSLPCQPRLVRKRKYKGPGLPYKPKLCLTCLHICIVRRLTYEVLQTIISLTFSSGSEGTHIRNAILRRIKILWQTTLQLRSLNIHSSTDLMHVSSSPTTRIYEGFTNCT